ncbi:lasso peptide biosynthesis B2 protein [Kitasatospora sp. NPDC057541]|uniref:lasso peptide biosynthesis B2 protein n=1 Tax=unclassified Kitasatospora TaxID=2633591 RepID=UPI0036A37F99
MTLHMTPEPRAWLPPHRRIVPLLAVAAGRLLAAAASPDRLERLLRRLSAGARPASYAEAFKAREDVVAVSGRCAGQYCLERSLAAVLLVRARGGWADWVSGVNLAPFAAHAWIEVDGKPVGEPLRLDGFHKNILVTRRPARAGRAAPVDGGE